VPTRANRLANAVSAFEKAQRELSEISLTGIKDKKFIADVKAARSAADSGRKVAVDALRQERPTVNLANAS
jgi:hypothetical protein